MVHFCLHAAHGTVLWRTHAEARALWDRLTARVRFQSLVLVPTHVHADTPDASEIPQIVVAMRGYALWRHRRRGESGAVWQPLRSPTPIRGPKHVERTRRYIVLNPCRDGLVDDPLAWPWSTHRDAVGLALPPVRRPVREPERFHAFVSGDPSVRPEGTPLPVRRPAQPDAVTLGEVVAAVSSLTRTPVSGLRVRGAARDLLIRAARTLTGATSSEIAAAAGVDPSTVRHVAREPDPRLVVVERVLGDPRFAPLRDGDLRHEPGWRKYRDLR